jgi:hypothetical protein
MAQQNNHTPGQSIDPQALQDVAHSLHNLTVPVVGSGDYQAVVNRQPQQLQEMTIQHNPFRQIPVKPIQPPQPETSADGKYIP